MSSKDLGYASLIWFSATLWNNIYSYNLVNDNHQDGRVEILRQS